MENKKIYHRKCMYCGKVISSLSETQAIYNNQIHEMSCKKKILKEVSK